MGFEYDDMCVGCECAHDIGIYVQDGRVIDW